MQAEWETKFESAIEIVKGLDEPCEAMFKSHGVTYDPAGHGLEVGPTSLIVSPQFILDSTRVKLCVCLMHEARHLSRNHYRRWQTFQEALRAHRERIPVEFSSRFISDKFIDWVSLQWLWNAVCDACINASLAHIPCMRDSHEAIRFGEPPLTELKALKGCQEESIMWTVLNSDTARNEFIQYLKKKGYV